MEEKLTLEKYKEYLKKKQYNEDLSNMKSIFDDVVKISKTIKAANKDEVVEIRREVGSLLSSARKIADKYVSKANEYKHIAIVKARKDVYRRRRGRDQSTRAQNIMGKEDKIIEEMTDELQNYAEILDLFQKIKDCDQKMGFELSRKIQSKIRF